MRERSKTFTQPQLEAIADALGDTTIGLTNPEIELLILSAKMIDPGKATKRIRIYNALVESRNGSSRHRGGSAERAERGQAGALEKAAFR